MGDAALPAWTRALVTYWTVLAGWLCVVGMYLFRDGQAHAFASYGVALGTLAGGALRGPGRAALRACGAPLWLALLWLALAVGSSLVAGSDGTDGPLRHLGWALLVALFLVAFAVAERRFPGRIGAALASSIALAAIAAAAAAFVQFQALHHFPHIRLAGLGRLANPVIAASSFSAGAIACVAMSGQVRHPALRSGWLLGALLLLVVVVLTMSRGPLLAALVVLTAQMLGMARIRALVWSAVAAACIVTWIFRYEPRSFVLAASRGDSYRLDIWQGALARLPDSRFPFGNGAGSATGEAAGMPMFDHFHNLYLATLWETGVAGLVLLAALLVVAFARLRQADGAYRGLGLPLLAFACLCFITDGATLLGKVDELWLLVWTPVGLAMVAPRGATRHGAAST